MLKENEKLAKDIITHCRQKIQSKFSFFSMALYFLKLEACDEIDTMATDGYNLYYNPEYVIEIYKSSREMLYASILHTVLHCLMRHFTKKQFTYHELFDASMDVTVYLMLCELGFITAKAKNMVLKTMPELEKLLKSQKSKNSVNIYNEALNDQKLEESLLNNRNLFELDDHIYWTHPKKKEQLNMQGIEVKAIWTKLFTETLSQLSAFGLQRGFVTGNFTQMLCSEETKASEVSYEEILRRFATFDEIMKIDTDNFDLMWYTTGLEMYGDMPIIEYNEVKEDLVINEFILAIDTSGSCSGKVMENFLRETIKIFKDMEIGNRRIKIKLIQCDMEIKDERDLDCQAEIESYVFNFEAYGFGGTDFNPVFKRVKELQEAGQFTNLKGLIYLSDGYGSFPQEKPPYETVFVLPPDEYEYKNEQIPDWVNVVRI